LCTNYCIHLEEFCIRVQKAVETLPQHSPTLPALWIDCGNLQKEFNTSLEWNWNTFKCQKKVNEYRSNDFKGIIIPGGSGIGKTRTGRQAATFFRQFDFGEEVKILDIFFVPHELLGSDGSGKALSRPPRNDGDVESALEQLVRCIMAVYFSVVFEKKSSSVYEVLHSLGASCTFENLIRAIRYQEQISDNIPIILVLQLDEFQEVHQTVVNMLRAIEIIIRNGTFSSTNCLLIPILTGTAPDTLETAELMKATLYGLEKLHLQPMSFEESINFVAHKCKENARNPPDSSNVFHQQIVTSCGGVPKFLEMYVSDLRDATLNSVHNAIEVFQRLCNSIASQYRIDRVEHAFGAENSSLPILTLLYFSHFKILVTRETRINGKTIGDVERSGHLFLVPEGRSYIVKIPLVWQLVLDTAMKTDIFPSQLIEFLFNIREATLTQLCLQIHYVSYRILQLMRIETVSFSTLYRGGATASQKVLNKKVKVPKTIELFETVMYTKDGSKYDIDTLKSVQVKHRDEPIDVTQGCYLVEARPRFPGPDAFTPHGPEQNKHIESGNPIPETSTGGREVKPEQIEKELEKSKQFMEELDSVLTVLSPKEYNGKIPAKTAIVCGKGFAAFVEGFVSPVSLPENPKIKQEK